MEESNLNQQLRAMYQPYLEVTYNQKWPEEAGLSAPLLMHVFKEYESMSRKVLFVGQETHGWDQMSKKLNVETLQKQYTDFNLGKSANYGDGKPLRYLRSPFWNFSRSLFYTLNISGNDVSRKTNGFLWTNISKFDAGTTTPNLELQQQNIAGFELLKQEIAVIKPDIVVFLTGTKYDNWIDHLFHPQKEIVIENNFLWRLSDSDQFLPELTFQTQHPRTLCMHKMYREVLSKITELATR